MTSQPLAPSLRAYDRKVLAAVPPSEWALITGGGRSLWQIGEMLDTIELAGLGQVLYGLERSGYIVRYEVGTAPGNVLKRRRWRRTPRGDEAVGS